MCVFVCLRTYVCMTSPPYRSTGSLATETNKNLIRVRFTRHHLASDPCTVFNVIAQIVAYTPRATALCPGVKFARRLISTAHSSRDPVPSVLSNMWRVILILGLNWRILTQLKLLHERDEKEGLNIRVKINWSMAYRFSGCWCW